ncbi:hypothetical protein [Cohnella fermenti]|uniref:Uncharacterized protein n=1 Tax=Cohnella fermenti TaxID=2565925 RepID=A0A4S4BKR3_9BACL|nr:hypothetical protein [Cohnella fermenti]THF74380.1 hypothetical protein E6C55_25390 [Cohnella fermenti]
MRVEESDVVYPTNGRGGLYILIEGTVQEVYKGASDRFAIDTANRRGWNGKGEATVGIPTRQGIDLYTRAYWFHEKL